jgi:hypothetical protein
MRAAPRLRFLASAAVPEAGAGASDDAQQLAPQVAIAAPSLYKLVTFYRFTPLEDPHAEVARHKAFCQARGCAVRRAPCAASVALSPV